MDVMTPEQIEELRAMMDDAKEIAEERREKHMESHMTAALIRNSPNPSSAKGWQMAADYALKTARILEAFPVAVGGCADVLRLTEERAALAEELARMRKSLLRIGDKAFINAGEFARYVREEVETALSHTGMTGPKEIA
jgi:hypothetical protein